MSRMEGTRSAAAVDTWAAYQRSAGVRGAGWLVVLGVHVAFVALWLSERAVTTKPLTLVRMQVVPLQPEPPEPPPPEPKPPLEPMRKPTLRQAPPPRAPEVRPAPMAAPVLPPVVTAPAPAAPRHVETDEWVRPEATPSGPGARRAPSEYADAVKSRVVAKVVYPANALYPAPKGFKGDPRELMRQCTIPYEVVVDRQGQIVSYEIERCNDDLLDAAAEAAVLKAQPFPPPPEGAEQYRIYGSINFMKPRLARPTGARP